MSVLDGQIANVALPTISRELGATPAASIWVVNGFQLAVTASLFTFAALGQVRGPARVWRAGVVVFVAGSLFCALARSLPLLVAARVLQGLGASAVMAISPALVREIFPRAQLGRGLGINALVIATSAAAGPTIGGLLLAVLPWPWLFAINVPLGAINMALNRALPDDREVRRGRLDALSVVTSALGLGLLIYGLDGIARREPLVLVALELAAGAVSLAVFAVRQFRLPVPMIALDLFANRAYALAGATSVGSFAAQGLAYVALPFFFQAALGRTPLECGLLLSSWPIATAIVAPLAGRLADRYPPPLLATCGLGVFAAGLGFYATLRPHPSATEIVLHGIICGVGFGFFQSPNNRELIGLAPREKSSSAGGLLAMFRLVGQTSGAAFVAIVFALVGVAAPITLWLAFGFALAAFVASGLRLVRPTRG